MENSRFSRICGHRRSVHVMRSWPLREWLCARARRSSWTKQALHWRTHARAHKHRRLLPWKGSRNSPLEMLQIVGIVETFSALLPAHQLARCYHCGCWLWFLRTRVALRNGILHKESGKNCEICFIGHFSTKGWIVREKPSRAFKASTRVTVCVWFSAVVVYHFHLCVSVVAIVYQAVSLMNLRIWLLTH